MTWDVTTKPPPLCPVCRLNPSRPVQGRRKVSKTCNQGCSVIVNQTKTPEEARQRWLRENQGYDAMALFLYAKRPNHTTQ